MLAHALLLLLCICAGCRSVMESRSSNLLSESKKFEKYGRYLNLQALYKTYGPIIAVVLVILFVIYIRFFR